MDDWPGSVGLFPTVTRQGCKWVKIMDHGKDYSNDTTREMNEVVIDENE